MLVKEKEGNMKISSIAVKASSAQAKGKLIGTTIGAGLGISYILKNRKDIFQTAIKNAPKQIGMLVGGGVSLATIGGLTAAGRMVGSQVGKFADSDKETKKKTIKGAIGKAIGAVALAAGTVVSSIVLAKKGKLTPNANGKKVVEIVKKGLSTVAEKTLESKAYKKVAPKVVAVVAAGNIQAGIIADNAAPIINNVKEKVSFVSNKAVGLKDKAIEKFDSVKKFVLKQGRHIKNTFTNPASGFNKASKYDAPFLNGLSGKSAKASAVVFMSEQASNLVEKADGFIKNMIK